MRLKNGVELDVSAGQIAKVLGDKLDNLRERAAIALKKRNGSEPTLA